MTWAQARPHHNCLGGGGADEGKSSCLMSRMGVARGEREIARERHP